MKALASSPETVVCILGAPRSGTSLTARILNLCGLYLGEAEDLIPPGFGNEAGYWELRRAVHLNERILVAMGGDRIAAPHPPSGWEENLDIEAERREARELMASVFRGRARWGWKDPRNSFTAPFWRGALPEMKQMRHVICVRNPLDTAASGSLLARRQPDLDRDRTLQLWWRYIASAIVNTSGQKRVFVAYETYFDDWRATAGRVAAFAELNLRHGECQQAVEALIDPGLRHHLTPVDEALHSDWIPARTRLLYAELQDRLHLDNSTKDPDEEAELDRFALSLLSAHPEGDPEHPPDRQRAHSRSK